jgi:hypothetical protein
MILGELGHDQCCGCGSSLQEAKYVERHDVIYAIREFAGEPGVAVAALCRCGSTSVVPFSVSPRRVA